MLNSNCANNSSNSKFPPIFLGWVFRWSFLNTWFREKLLNCNSFCYQIFCRMTISTHFLFGKVQIYWNSGFLVKFTCKLRLYDKLHEGRNQKTPGLIWKVGRNPGRLTPTPFLVSVLKCWKKKMVKWKILALPLVTWREKLRTKICQSKSDLGTFDDPCESRIKKKSFTDFLAEMTMYAKLMRSH